MTTILSTTGAVELASEFKETAGVLDITFADSAKYPASLTNVTTEDTVGAICATIATNNGENAIVSGLNNTNNVVNSFVIGEMNTNDGDSSLVAGQSNNNQNGGDFSLVVGTSNTNSSIGSLIGGDSNSDSVGYSIIGGKSNDNQEENSLVIGNNNRNRGSSNILAGSSNNPDGYNSLVVGTNNTSDSLAGNVVMGGTSNISLAIDTAVFGKTNTASLFSESALVFGLFNNTTNSKSLIGGTGNSLLGGFSAVDTGIVAASSVTATDFAQSFLAGLDTFTATVNGSDGGSKTFLGDLIIRNGNNLTSVPSSSSDTVGYVGQIIYDDNYLYVRTPSVWGRIGLTLTWS